MGLAYGKRNPIEATAIPVAQSALICKGERLGGAFVV
jgi:hypothetical protein